MTSIWNESYFTFQMLFQVDFTEFAAYDLNKDG